MCGEGGGAKSRVKTYTSWYFLGISWYFYGFSLVFLGISWYFLGFTSFSYVLVGISKEIPRNTLQNQAKPKKYQEIPRHTNEKLWKYQEIPRKYQEVHVFTLVFARPHPSWKGGGGRKVRSKHGNNCNETNIQVL